MSEPKSAERKSSPDFVLLGMDNHYSYQVTEALLERQFRPRAMIMAATTANPESMRFADIDIDVNPGRPHLAELCNRQQLACHQQVNSGLKELLSVLAMDFLLVACWPRKLTRAEIQAARYAALNLHPSLLPRYRGRDPISDQLGAGESRFGVSLHLLSAQIDAGDIILQQGFQLRPPVTRQAIERQAASIGADLFIRAVSSYHQPGWQPLPQPRLTAD
ncbi:MAG: formyltransferase family protein [Gammaproteobacteria bacterium]|nr:formyltransferase family protein [Gammaproteobacteria bacterium]